MDIFVKISRGSNFSRTLWISPDTIESSKKLKQSELLKKEEITDFKKLLHVKPYFSDKKYDSRSPKNSNLLAKIAKN